MPEAERLNSNQVADGRLEFIVTVSSRRKSQTDRTDRTCDTKAQRSNYSKRVVGTVGRENDFLGDRL